MNILFLLIGLLVGISVTLLIESIRLSSDKKISEVKINSLTENLEKVNSEIEEKRVTIIDLNKSLSAAESIQKNLEEKLETQKEEIEQMHNKLTLEFKNLANEILEDKSKRFTEENKTNMNDILKPLGEKIEDFKKKVEDAYDKESQQRYSLKVEIKNLIEFSQQISKEATNLTNALKGQAKTQGNWGEMILENILENSGLQKDREYFIQPSYNDEDGKRLQPDVILKFPGFRNVVLDSKVSLTAYERYSSSEDKILQDLALKEHIQSIKNHIIELAAKNYQDLYQLNTLDFVILFIPIEPAYMLAIQNENQLWNYAYDKRILLISPTNLIAVVKMTENFWRQEYQNKNAVEIAQKGGELYDKFVGLVEDLVEIGKKMDSTKESYNSAMNKLHEGRGNLIKRAQDIKELGAKTTKSLPQTLIDRAE
ncbi:MAG: DNA recombination protein RmuC [FCB group bacterium]|jgi:DNA recombination protein RmuC